jgi:hypothetical protein
MLNIGSIKSSIVSGKNGGKTALMNDLSAHNFSPEEIAALSPIIDQLCTETPEDSKIQSEYDRIKKFSETNLKQVVIQARQAQREKIDSQNMTSHNPFNSKRAFSLVEPMASDAHFTEVADIENANYSIAQDYPNTTGSLDETMNWVKINKSKNSVELVHRSRTQIKIDKDGNVTMYIAGSFKQIIMGDHYYECRGNSDVVVNGNSYQHISGESVNKYDLSKTDDIGIDHTQTIGENRSTKIGMNDTTNVEVDTTMTSGGKFSNTVTGDASLKAANISSNSDGKTDSIAGGVNTVKGSKVNFNT